MRGLVQATILTPEEIERLAKIGISNLSQVIEAANEPHERCTIARRTGIAEETLWQLACITDLCRIPGLGPRRGLLLSELECACTVKDLAECDPRELSLKLEAQFGSLGRSIPSFSQLKRYIEAAQITAPLLQPASGPSEVDREFETIIATQVSNVWQQIRVFGVLLGLSLATFWVSLLIGAFQVCRDMRFVASVFPGATEAISGANRAVVVWVLSVPPTIVAIPYAFLVSRAVLSTALYRLVSRLTFRSRGHKLLAIEARRASMKAYDMLRTWIRSHVPAICVLLVAIVVTITLFAMSRLPSTENVGMFHILSILLTIVGPIMFVTILAIWIVAFRSELREVRKVEGWSRSFERRYVSSEVGFYLADWSIFGVGVGLLVWLEVNVLGMITINLYNNLTHAMSRLALLVEEHPDEAIVAILPWTQPSLEDLGLGMEVVKTQLPQLVWKGIVWWLALTFALALVRLFLIQGRKALIFVLVSAVLGGVWEATLVERVPGLLGIGQGSLLAWAIRLTFLPVGFFITDYVYEWVAAQEATCPVCEWDTELGDRYCAHCGSLLDRFAVSTPICRQFDRLRSLLPFLQRNTTHSRD